MNTMIKQAEFCYLMMEKLVETVSIREKDAQAGNRGWIGYTLTTTSGAGKYQIKDDIKRLRRELQRLAEMVEQGG